MFAPLSIHSPRCGTRIIRHCVASSRRKTTSSTGTASTTLNPPVDQIPSPQFDHVEIRNEIENYWFTSEANTRWYWCFSAHEASREYRKPTAAWHWLDRELSSNMAGETGAVHIYKGALAALSIRPINDQVLEFCQSHMKNEMAHLDMFQSIVPKGKHTKLLPIWRMAGFTLGFFPTLLGGSQALYVTVEAVETFVEEHFQEQIVSLKKENVCPNLVQLLEHCCEDEVHHKEDAARRLLNGKEGYIDLDAFWVQPWKTIVRGGSAVAADIARRIWCCSCNKNVGCKTSWYQYTYFVKLQTTIKFVPCILLFATCATVELQFVSLPLRSCSIVTTSLHQ